jgi:hypothetical protein
MFDEIDRAYYARRAEEERERAGNASKPSAVKIHMDLAREYEQKLQATVTSFQ